MVTWLFWHYWTYRQRSIRLIMKFFCIDSRCHTALAVQLQSTAGSHPTCVVESSTFDASRPSRRRNSCFTAYLKGRSLGRSCSCYTRRTWYSWLNAMTWAHIYTQMIPRSMVRVGRQRPHSCSIVCPNVWLTLPPGCSPITRTKIIIIIIIIEIGTNRKRVWNLPL